MADSVYHAVVLDVIAEMNLKTLMLDPQAAMQDYILEKHYMRKHGINAYYGQGERQDNKLNISTTYYQILITLVKIIIKPKEYDLCLYSELPNCPG